MTIMGKNFGSSPLKAVVASILSIRGGGACTPSLWSSDSHLTCQTPPGLGGDASVTVGYAGNTKDIGTLTLAFTYDAPSIFSTGFFQGESKISNVPVNAPTVIPITGQNFGAEDYSDQASVGGTICVRTVWRSDSRVECSVPKGLLETHSVVVSVSAKVGTLTQAISYDRPKITQMMHQNGAAGGAASLTVFGLNFGTYTHSQTFILGDTKADVVIWTSDSAMVTRIPMGRGIAQTVAVLQSKREGGGTHSTFFTYDNPAITSVRRNGPQSGGMFVTVTGASFGGVAPTSLELKIGDTRCVTETWTSDSSMTCDVSPGFGQQDLTLRISPGQLLCMDGSGAATCEETMKNGFVYDGPHPAALNGSVNGPSSGMVLITVTGTLFGVSDPGAHLYAKVGDTKCNETTWVSPTSLTCKINPGVGSLGINVNLGGAESGIKRVFTYNTASIDTWSVFEGPQAGGVPIALTGTSFVSPGLGASGITIDGNDCPVAQWYSETSITILSAPGVKMPTGNFVQVGAPGTPISELKTFAPWTYQHPMIIGASPEVMMSLDAGKNFTVIGRNFGGYDSTPTVFLGTDQSKCSTTTWESDSSLVCTTPKMKKGTFDISYLSGAQGNSKNVLVSSLAAATSTDTTNQSAPFAAYVKDAVEFIMTPPILALKTVQIVAADCDLAQTIEVGLGVTMELAPGWCSASNVSDGSILIYVTSFQNAPFKPDATNSISIASQVIISVSFRGLAPIGPVDIKSPLDLDMVSEGAQRRRQLLQFGGKTVRQAWLNQCTSKWEPLCTTTTSATDVKSSVPPEVATDACYDVSSKNSQKSAL